MLLYLDFSQQICFYLAQKKCPTLGRTFLKI
jgi:hypothetical protein